MRYMIFCKPTMMVPVVDTLLIKELVIKFCAWAITGLPFFGMHNDT